MELMSIEFPTYYTKIQGIEVTVHDDGQIEFAVLCSCGAEPYFFVTINDLDPK